MANQLNSTSQRWACAMWDFSWLVRRRDPTPEYADWDKILDELVLRGYNCVRIDAFPHLIAHDQQEKNQEDFTMLPLQKNFMWGNQEPIQVNPRKALIDFFYKAKARNLKIGLSTWLTPDESQRRNQIKRPADFARIWNETLGLLKQNNLLDLVLWVDICNEFPLDIWAVGAAQEIFGSPAETPKKMFERHQNTYNPQVAKDVQRYFTECITSLKEAFPNIAFTFSFTSLLIKQFGQLDLSQFDLIDAHIWTSDDPKFKRSTWQNLPLALVNFGVQLHAWRARQMFPKYQKEWVNILEQQTDAWSAIADQYKIPLFTTEGWGPVNYNDISPNGQQGEWDWVKTICAEGARMAVRKGWKGICSSNFCQPHFKGMWNDVYWHQKVTEEILGK
jgi:hypothetical protein